MSSRSRLRGEAGLAAAVTFGYLVDTLWIPYLMDTVRNYSVGNCSSAVPRRLDE